MPEGSETGQALGIRELRSKRASAFRSEVFPYFRYVAQSGFGLFVSAIFFALIIGYGNLLRNVPADLPAGLAGTAAVTLAAVRTRLRTYMQPADPVFLLAAESAVLRACIGPALLASMRGGAVRTVCVYAVFLPLYIRAPATEAAAAGRPLWLLGASFAALGAWNGYAAWRERQTAFASRRLALRGARYAASLLTVGALLAGPLLPAFGAAVGSVLIVTLLWRLPKRHALPWEKLIAEEAAARRRWHRFLGWFVDVPAADSRPARRRWAAWLGESLPWHRRFAWHYLYVKTFIRGETFGAWLRWHAVIAIVLIAFDRPAGDWIAFGIGAAVGGVQLTELSGWRLALSAETLPIRREDGRAAASAIARAAGLLGTALLWLIAAIPQGWPAAATWPAFAALAAGMLWSGWIIPARIARRREDDE